MGFLINADPEYNTSISPDRGDKSVSIRESGRFASVKKQAEHRVLGGGLQLAWIDRLSWSMSAVGYVELYWECRDSDPDFIVNLSGNGTWDLNDTVNYLIPDRKKHTGRVLLSTRGFDALDAYSIIITGKRQHG